MTKYKSGLEKRVHEALGEKWEYEPESFDYTVARRYTPDFCWNDGEEREVWIEVKGFFREGDTAKYKAIRQCYPNIRLVFVFHAPFKKVRKRGKITMAEWAQKNGWEWTTPDALEEEGIDI